MTASDYILCGYWVILGAGILLAEILPNREPGDPAEKEGQLWREF